MMVSSVFRELKAWRIRASVMAICPIGETAREASIVTAMMPPAVMPAPSKR